MYIVYTLIAALFAILIIYSIVVSKELADIRETLKLTEKWEHEKWEAQNGINNNMMSSQDHLLAMFGDLNTQIIELEAKIPEPEYNSTDEDYSEKVEAED